jgi:hypothetical protein
MLPLSQSPNISPGHYHPAQRRFYQHIPVLFTAPAYHPAGDILPVFI